MIIKLVMGAMILASLVVIGVVVRLLMKDKSKGKRRR